MLKYPHEIHPIDENWNRRLLNDFHGERTGFCQTGERKWIMPAAFKNVAKDYYNIQPKADDIWVVTYPRSGTTVCQELVWMINNNLDYETSYKVSLQDRFPFLEVSVLLHDDYSQVLIDINNDPEVTKLVNTWKIPGNELLNNLPSPRHIKTHLPFDLLPPSLLSTSKTFYVARNPKDAAVSYYHHNRLVTLHDYKGDFNQYWEYFKKDLLVYSPYWAHIEDAWARRDSPNLFFLYFEDMAKDMPGVIRKVARFLNKPMTDEQVDKLADHLKIDNFRKNVPLLTGAPLKGFVNESEEGFVRKGKVGGNKEFTDEMTREANEWIQENLKRNKISPFPV